MNKLRSLNPALLEPGKFLSRYAPGFDVTAADAQAIIDKLDLKRHYPDGSRLDIIETNPGRGFLTSMLNYELKPRNHILLTSNMRLNEAWKKTIEELNSKTKNVENFRLFFKTPYQWSSYRFLVDEDVIHPKTIPMYKDHDELLIVGNWTDARGESMIAQWIHCVGNGNWLMRYGKVRMILAMPLATAQKFFCDPGFVKRARSAFKRDFVTESKVIAIGNDTNILGKGYDPRVLYRDQPLIIDKRLNKKPANFAVVEMIPNGRKWEELGDMIYLLLPIFMYRKQPLKECLFTMGPGAEYMMDSIPQEVLEKRPRDFTPDDMLHLLQAYQDWPFKPPISDIVAEGNASEDEASKAD